jgi:Sulfotransferase family
MIFHLNLDKVDTKLDDWLRNSGPQNSVTLSQSARHEEEAALAYVRSIHNLERSLTFLHIPKTAGTALENAAGEAGINWGSCLFRHKPRRDICKYPGDHDWPQYVGWWHIPSHFFPLAGTNPYEWAEMFAVIRDPYDRMVSEYYYMCTLKVMNWRPDQCNRTRLSEKAYMNEWLTNKLNDQRTPKSALRYLTDNGHFTPQYEFIVGPNEVRMVDYVLRLDDTLKPSFSRLMKGFGLKDVRLKKFNAIGAGSREEGANLGVEDLDETAVSWIHKKYPSDFGEFLYDKRQ